MITSSKYFFQGLPANFALVDFFTNAIYLTLPEENIAHQLVKIFYGKANLIVVDLTSFSNYNKNLIDNSVCVNWSTSSIQNPGKHRKSLYNPDYTNTHVADYFNDSELHNVNTSILPESLLDDLQQQLMLVYKILKFEAGISKREILYNIELSATVDAVKKICATEISLIDIESKLKQLANVYLCSPDGIMANILECMDSLYE